MSVPSKGERGSLAGLWTCPQCGRKLVGRNMAHSCSDATVAGFLAKATPHVRALYDRFESMIAACGPYLVSPAQTRIAFMGRVRSAGLSNLTKDGMRVAFALPKPVRSRRFSKVDEIVPGWWGHHLQVTRLEELDSEMQGWLKESYRLIGMQERPESRPKRKRMISK